MSLIKSWLGCIKHEVKTFSNPFSVQYENVPSFHNDRSNSSHTPALVSKKSDFALLNLAYHPECVPAPEILDPPFG